MLNLRTNESHVTGFERSETWLDSLEFGAECHQVLGSSPEVGKGKKAEEEGKLEDGKRVNVCTREKEMKEG